LDIGGRVFEDREAFADFVVDRAVSRLPTPDDIMAGVYVTYRPALLLSHADVEADHLAAETMRAQQEEERARTARAREEAHAQRRIVWAEEQAQTRIVEERERAQRRLIQAEVDERELQLRAMHEAELEQARRHMAEMRSPFQEVFDQLRAQIHEDVRAIAAGIESHGYLHGKTAEKASGLVETFRLLNAHGDTELENALDALRAKVATRIPDPDKEGKQIRDLDAITAELDRITHLTRASAQALAEGAGSTRAGALML
jgi:hypothetical protein